ncbi:MAG: hypothetical protein U0105_02490 [Candidatus Obscuribacterales bacterium]
MIGIAFLDCQADIFARHELRPVRVVGVIEFHAERLRVESQRLVEVGDEDADEPDFH